MTARFDLSEAENYIREFYDTDDPIRHEMEALAQKRNFPIIGLLAGRHLYQLTRMIQGRRVFEMGSGYGYSALFFARAVGPHGEVHGTDFSADNIRLAEEFLSRAGVWTRVTYHQEDGVAVLKRLGGLWDVIYNDIDKKLYPDTVALAHDYLRPGGLFITDNLMWSGRVWNEQDNQVSTQGIREFTRQLFEHPGFMTTLYPVRDGLAVALKIA